MFWRRKNTQAEPAQESPRTARRAPQLEDNLQRAANALAKTFADYGEAARRAAKQKPDEEVVEGRRKLEVARKLLYDSGLDYALGRCIPEHIQHWESWSRRDDFQKWVGFAARSIVASKHKEPDLSREAEVLTVDCTFKGQAYTFVLKNLGYSSAPGDAVKFGEFEVWSNDERMVAVSLIDNLGDYSHWKFMDVKGLRPGRWMKDMLEISSQIDAHDQRRRSQYDEDKAREANRNIDLG